MDGLTLLQEARAAGLEVEARDGRLVVRGPRRAEHIARQLLEHKALVLEALASGAPEPGITPADLPPEWHLLWDERAAIMEYDGGLPKEHAEAAALAEVLDQMRRAGHASGSE